MFGICYKNSWYTAQQFVEAANSFKTNSNAHTTAQLIQAWLKKDEVTFKTSGSTGNPKLISFKHEQIANSAKQSIHALQLKNSAIFYVCLNTGFVGGAMQIARALVLGAKVVLVEPSANSFEEFNNEYHCNITSLVPMMIENLTYDEKKILNEFDTILIGGAAVNKETEEFLKTLKTNVFLTYGMTETLSHIALRNIKTQERFVALNEVKISTNNDGCLVIECDYLNEKIITHDLVKIYNDHSFEILGRNDFIINSGGVKINPFLIEQIIEKNKSKLNLHHNRYFIGSTQNKMLGQAVTLFVEGNTLTEAEINLNELKPYLPKHHMPKKIVVLENFVYTPSGKINRKLTQQSAD